MKGKRNADLEQRKKDDFEAKKPAVYRGQHDIIESILRSTIESKSQTNIMYESKLSYIQANKYIQWMLKLQLLTQSNGNTKRSNQNVSLYVMTSRGKELYRILAQVKSFLREPLTNGKNYSLALGNHANQEIAIVRLLDGSEIYDFDGDECSCSHDGIDVGCCPKCFEFLKEMTNGFDVNVKSLMKSMTKKIADPGMEQQVSE